MSQAVEYAIGTIEGSIHEFVLGMQEPPAGMSYALITCLDSCTEPASLVNSSEPLRTLGSKITVIGDAILLATKQLIAAENDRRLFFGFDEVWFVSRKRIAPKPKSLSLVSPLRLQESDIATHEVWLKESGCTLGLGDGAGMSFCVKARGATKLLLDSLSENQSVHA